MLITIFVCSALFLIYFFSFSFSETNMKLACNVSREDLLSFGTCFGKFTKTKKFRLHITALDYLAPYAKVSKIQFPPVAQTMVRKVS